MGPARVLLHLLWHVQHDEVLRGLHEDPLHLRHPLLPVHDEHANALLLSVEVLHGAAETRALINWNDNDINSWLWKWRVNKPLGM